MAAILTRSQPTVDAIFSAYEARADKGFRPHLGASLIGRDCDRALWMSFRWVTAATFTGRMLRIFETGNREEPRLVKNLRDIGVEVREADDNGKQFNVSAHGGHFGGSMDGAGIGFPESPKTWHVIEFKTHGEKSFKELCEKGVERAKPVHAAQMQTYMHLTGMERAMYLAVNKNTDEIYSERLKYDKGKAEQIIARAGRIVFAANPPERISDDPSWHKCRFCDHAHTCHGSRRPERNCRTCLHATPEPDGSWSCVSGHDVFSDDPLPTKTVAEQREGCRKHLWIPRLINDRQVDAGDRWIEYVGRGADGITWRDEGPE